MSTDITILLKAVDKASDTIKGVATTADTSLGKMKDANTKVEKSSKDVALAFNNVATSGLALYNAIDRVETAQVALDRANLAVKTTANAVEDAQRKYNATVEKFGVDSQEATLASGDLKLAQERYEVACERANLAQGNVNQAMMSAAVTVIPSLITMITSVSTLTQSWTGIQAALNVVMDANPIALVILAIAALTAAIILLWNFCPPFRDAIIDVATALSAGLGTAITAVRGALEYVWNNVLVPLGNFLSGTLLAAWNTLANGISWAYNNILKPVFDALAWVWNNILKPIADAIGAIVGAVTGFLGGGGTPSNQNPNAGGHWQEGGIVTKPTFGVVGEAGPEAVIPLANLGGLFQPQPVEITIPQSTSQVTVEINAPIVYVEGAADRNTARLCARLIKDALKNVVIEATSVNAPTSQKQIRLGSSTTSILSGLGTVSRAPNIGQRLHGYTQ